MTDSALAREIFERTWNAPLQTVWELWTTPDGFASWFGPRGFRAEVDSMDLRPGGKLVFRMIADSPQMVARFEAMGRPTSWSVEAVYDDVEPMTRLSYTTADAPMGPGQTTEFRRIVTFEETDEGVKMVLVLEAGTPRFLGGAAMGFKSALERFGEQLGFSAG